MSAPCNLDIKAHLIRLTESWTNSYQFYVYNIKNGYFIMQRIPMTREGHEALEAELKNLKTVERPNIIQAISVAREHGDLSENAEYHAAKEKQSFIEGRLAELEDKLARADVIDITKFSGSKIIFGATVTLIDVESEKESTYKIVGEDEADVASGKISITSPIARALIGKEAGDEAEVNAPGGARAYEIADVTFR